MILDGLSLFTCPLQKRLISADRLYLTRRKINVRREAIGRGHVFIYRFERWIHPKVVVKACFRPFVQALEGLPRAVSAWDGAPGGGAEPWAPTPPEAAEAGPWTGEPGRGTSPWRWRQRPLGTMVAAVGRPCEPMLFNAFDVFWRLFEPTKWLNSAFKALPGA